MTLVVLGDLQDNVVDPANGMSKQLLFVMNERKSGNHMCVVTAHGFGMLLEGRAAPCQDLERLPSGDIRFASRPDSLSALKGSPSVFGEPVSPRATPEHGISNVTVDLDALDRGSEAHELIVAAVIQHLTPQEPLSPGLGAPRFDLGWQAADGSLIIAEVKSLPSEATGQAQQLRLGLGQILEYSQRVRLMAGVAGPRVQPALIVQQEPDDPVWVLTCESVGVILSWAPEFPGLRESP